MTDMTMTHRPEDGLVHRLWLRLQLRLRHRAKLAVLASLPDHVLRDIGLERDGTEHREIRTLHNSMRFLG